MTTKPYTPHNLFAYLLNRFVHVQLFTAPWTVPARLLCPWDFPGENTGIGCHFLLHVISLHAENTRLGGEYTSGSQTVHRGTLVISFYFVINLYWSIVAL